MSFSVFSLKLGHILWGLFGLIVAKLSWEILLSPLRVFPGPFLAKITDTYRAALTVLGHIDSVHLDWHKRYGTAVRIGPNCISISDPGLIRTIYATKDAWLKSDMYRPNDALINGQRIHNIFNTRDNAWHDKHLKPIRSFWTMTKVLEIEPLIDETLDLFMSKLETNFLSELGKRKTVCMMDDWLGYFAWDVAANISFGQNYGFLDQEKDVDNLIVDSTKGLYYFALVSQIPWIDLFLDKNPLVRIGPKPTLTGIFYAFNVVAQYQANITEKGNFEESGKTQHYLDKYIKLKDQYPEMVNDSQLVNWLMLNVLAGGDTTSATMRAVVYYLAKAPEAYTKLIEELEKAQIPLPAQWKDIKNLPYLDAVVREAIRFNPSLAMVLEREVPKTGFTLPDGRYIPAGTKVGINPAVVNRDREVFGADADIFNPDRWLTKDGARLKRMRDTADFTFGAGSRVCMGRYFAQLELYKLFATLYSLYDIKLVDPEHKWKYRDAWFIYQWDMPMRITRRDSNN